MSNFEDWWPTVGQNIGKVAAKNAWEYQQARIDELKASIVKADELHSVTFKRLHRIREVAQTIAKEKQAYKNFNREHGYDSAFAAYDRMHDAIDALTALLEASDE